ncbi:1-phosphatidylinositol-3-phosphate 5-kinase FAB1A isoform X1 [Gossypium arboreum]|uniref:1-phosphatidylinositol-3-phosphate 5-kinase FAB1A isoform X1 n=1 Tax=Gossypium arboreum TaxID=29729 RepID=UPI00081970AB|nr:1-phosphatidylinositol-3-phosphate 5-kinase FAB1A isoform X1 [Gossypium arboreum]XP_017606517.1 1-phosphatidylinositol-3-phosphate 5-kinase FAB1A isoform X1 [Gossypium arboreum]
MGTSDDKQSDHVDTKSWIPRSELLNVSRDFWMPDQSCRVCYECDSQFTIFNRRHHCRLCGRVFCAKCTANSVPVPSDEPRAGREDSERIRVCNYCFKQWEQGIAVDNNGTKTPSPDLSPSPSAASLASTKSSCTYNSGSSFVGSTPYATGPYYRVNCNSGLSHCESSQMNGAEQNSETSGMSTDQSSALVDSYSNRFDFCSNRSDDEDDDYGAYRSDSESKHYAHAEEYYGAINIDEYGRVYGSDKVHPDAVNIDAKSLSGSPLAKNFDTSVDEIKKFEEENEQENADEGEAPAYDVDGTDAEPVDFENNWLLWLPPEPADGEDEREAALFDDDDEDEGATGEWGYLRSNSFGTGERSRDKSVEEHRRAMKNVVEGHFRALVSQLLQVENLPVRDDDGRENWLDIITSLSWEAATLLKPDTSKGGGMDPGGYVKVKCIASGRPSESAVVKGVVCKKNVAHRRMTSKIEKPRFLILGGALEYQRISNHLSSFDTLLQQEMDHLKMAVAKIGAHHPNVLLVEKSVSRYAQDYLLAKDISLVLNIKRPLLERIARCTGAQIVPSIDHLTSPKLGYCDVFHVEKFFEEHGSAGQGGKRLTKTLMFFEGCPKPLGYTILLKGANGDELKKVKHVVQYGVFAAYHLALETSFLADEGATLPELPLKSPITVALPDKPSSIDRSISIVPGFTIPSSRKPMASQSINELQKSNKGVVSDGPSFANNLQGGKSTEANLSCLSKGPQTVSNSKESVFDSVEDVSSLNSQSASRMETSSCDYVPSSNLAFCKVGVDPKESVKRKTTSSGEDLTGNQFISLSQKLSEAPQQRGGSHHADCALLAAFHLDDPGMASSKQEPINNNEEAGSSKDEFSPSPSDHQSILVSLSTRCVLKGTVCERSHLFRIKYYGSFDKPLGRFLQDHLFDQSSRCRSCEMPSEAHVHCYTHRQGSLTISVKKLPDPPLPGEREDKIWMWHRCLRCPRTNGFPPATRRVVMSDAAWGLSFGKFLELSFSNHAAASRVASCGHSLHRDCLRFYGFGRMVACFRYASIDVHSVYLPPSKLEFNHDNQEWIQSEANEVSNRAEFLFSEVYNALQKFSEKLLGSESNNCGIKAPERRSCIEELEAIFQKDRKEFQDSLQEVLCKEVKVGQPVIDILEVNKLRRKMLFLSYIWDQRLIHAYSSLNNNIQEVISSPTPKLGLKPTSSVEKLVEMNVSPKPTKVISGCSSALVENKPDINMNQVGNTDEISKPGGSQKEKHMDQNFDNRKEAESSLSSSANSSQKSDSVESERVKRGVLSEGEFPSMENLSDTLEAAWTGETHPGSVLPKENGCSVPDSAVADMSAAVSSDPGNRASGRGEMEVARSPQSDLPTKGLESMEKPMSWESMPFPNFHDSFNKNSSFNVQKLNVSEHNPVYISSFRELEKQSGPRLLLPVGVNETVVPVYDDEPASIIAYALVSSDYHSQISELERRKDAVDSAVSSSLFDSINLLSLNSFSDISDTYRSFGSGDDSILSLSGSQISLVSDPLLYTKDLHARVSFTDDGPLGKVKYSVTCYYAKRFESLRRTCCPSELDFIRSLSRCKKWDAQGGKSKVFFAKTLDDRFIIKQVTKTELESFVKFGPAYFKYLSDSINTRSPTCLAKILGIYQVSSKHLKGGKESKMDVLVMENLLFRRKVTRLYDLKGSSRSRYNPDTSGSNKVLLDQNLIEAMPTSPIFVGSKAKRLLERAVWNDTSFLALVDVMDYSLLVGVDEEKHELVLGIIDFMRQYTWDKHLETWVKTSGILGGQNAPPTVISPQQYKKRFRKAMTAYFLMVPDQWSPPTIAPSGSQTDLCEENTQGGNSVE